MVLMKLVPPIVVLTVGVTVEFSVLVIEVVKEDDTGTDEEETVSAVDAERPRFKYFKLLLAGVLSAEVEVRNE